MLHLTTLPERKMSQDRSTQTRNTHQQFQTGIFVCFNSYKLNEEIKKQI